MNQLLDRWLDVLEVERTTRINYVGKIEKHIRPTDRRAASRPAGCRDDRLALREPRGDAVITAADVASSPTGPQVSTSATSTALGASAPRSYATDPTADCKWCQRACGPHVCEPLAVGSIRVVHAILSGALTRAVRWGWIAVNPLDQVEPPATPTANPRPPTSAEAARDRHRGVGRPGLGHARVAGDDDRRAARRTLRAALDRTWISTRRSHVRAAVSARSPVRCGRRTPRPIRLGASRWTARRSRYSVSTDAAATSVRRRSASPCAPTASCSHSRRIARRQIRPDTITQRYRRLATRLGIDTTLHALRHYSATELIAAGVDPRTVAGRLGHAGGGSTTLRVYSAWVAEADQRAAAALAARVMPMRRRTPRQTVPTAHDPPPRHDQGLGGAHLRTLRGNAEQVQPGRALHDMRAAAGRRKQHRTSTAEPWLSRATSGGTDQRRCRRGPPRLPARFGSQPGRARRRCST